MKTPTSRKDYWKERHAKGKATIKKCEDQKQKDHTYNQMYYQRDKELAEKYGLNVVSTLQFIYFIVVLVLVICPCFLLFLMIVVTSLRIVPGKRLVRYRLYQVIINLTLNCHHLIHQGIYQLNSHSVWAWVDLERPRRRLNSLSVWAWVRMDRPTLAVSQRRRLNSLSVWAWVRMDREQHMTLAVNQLALRRVLVNLDNHRLLSLLFRVRASLQVRPTKLNPLLGRVRLVVVHRVSIHKLLRQRLISI